MSILYAMLMGMCVIWFVTVCALCVTAPYNATGESAAQNFPVVAQQTARRANEGEAVIKELLEVPYCETVAFAKGARERSSARRGHLLMKPPPGDQEEIEEGRGEDVQQTDDDEENGEEEVCSICLCEFEGDLASKEMCKELRCTVCFDV